MAFECAIGLIYANDSNLYKTVFPSYIIIANSNEAVIPNQTQGETWRMSKSHAHL